MSLASLIVTWGEMEAAALLGSAGRIPTTSSDKPIDYKAAGDKIIALAEQIKEERLKVRGE